jgi:hypothetical protein
MFEKKHLREGGGGGEREAGEKNAGKWWKY